MASSSVATVEAVPRTQRHGAQPAPAQAGSELLLFFLVPSFTMMAFTSAVEPLRLANREAGRELYRWKLVSRDGLPVAASNGISVQVDAAMRDCEPMAGVRPAVVVCGGIGTERYQDRDVFAWLRRHDRHGAEIGALCTARACAGPGRPARRATAARSTGRTCRGLAEAFPEIEVTGDLFEIDRKRFTCSGGTAAFDLMLHRIAVRHGEELAARISEQSASSTASAARTTASACRCPSAWASTTRS